MDSNHHMFPSMQQRCKRSFMYYILFMESKRWAQTVRVCLWWLTSEHSWHNPHQLFSHPVLEVAEGSGEWWVVERPPVQEIKIKDCHTCVHPQKKEYTVLYTDYINNIPREMRAEQRQSLCSVLFACLWWGGCCLWTSWHRGPICSKFHWQSKEGRCSSKLLL